MRQAIAHIFAKSLNKQPLKLKHYIFAKHGF